MLHLLSPVKSLESEVLGIPTSTDTIHAVLDSDLGRAAVISADVLRHSFKTPTVRNASLTAPYMHNGVFATLDEVIDFYDRGGGAGLGLDVPNQTLPAGRLNLTRQEKEDIIAFMQSLTDTASAESAPQKLPRSPGKSELNKRITGGKY